MGKSMEKMLSVACIYSALLFFSAGVVAAESTTYNMNEITCKEMLEDQENLTTMLIWIDGYLSHKSGNMSMSEASMIEIAKGLEEECKGKPERTLGNILK